MKLAIDIGHNAPYDLGAMGIMSEDTLNFQVGNFLIEKCISAGIQVVRCAPKNVVSLSDSLRKRVNIANDSNADFFISIHHNATPGGQGSEIYCYPGGKGEEVSKVVLPEIVSLGFKNRGVKAGSFYVLKHTNMSAILIECAFCDSQVDMRNYNCEKMAEAIFRGIIKGLKIKVPKDNEPSEVMDYHVVKAGDTLLGICRRYNITIKRVLELNDIKNIDFIQIGLKIRIK